MKRLITLSAMVTLALLVVAGPALAQDERPRGERPRGERRRPTGNRMRRRTPPFNIAQFRQLLGKLDLTDEQKEKIAKLSKDFEKKTAEQKEKVAALRKNISEARKAEDRDKLTELRQEFRKLQTTGTEATKEYVESVKKVLTDEQKKKLEESQKPVPGIPLLLQAIKGKSEELKLTEEQQEKTKALAEEYKPAEGEGQRPDYQALREKTRKMREDGASREEIRKAFQEAQKKQVEQRAKMQKRCGEFVAKLAKILKPEQMKLVMETARSNTGRRPRGRGRGGEEGGGERPRRSRRGGDREE